MQNEIETLVKSWQKDPSKLDDTELLQIANGIFRCGWCSISMDATDMISYRYHWSHQQKSLSYLCSATTQELERYGVEKPDWLRRRQVN